MPIGKNGRIEKPAKPKSKYSEKKIQDEFRRLLQERDQTQPQDPVARLVRDVTRPGPLTRSRDDSQQALLKEALASQSRREIVMDRLRVMADKSLQEAHIVELAKPVLPDNKKWIFDRLKNLGNYLKQGNENPLSEREYITLIKEGLKVVSPETWEDYKNYGVQFVAVQGDEEIQWNNKGDRNQWQLQFPVNHEKPIAHIMRAIDTLLHFDKAATRQIPGLERRLEMAARAYDGFEMLGEEYGWSTRGVPQARVYYEHRNNGIREDFRGDRININMPQDSLKQKGHDHGFQGLLNDCKGKDIHATFAPARYVISEMHVARREGQKPVMVRPEEPEDLGGLLDEVWNRRTEEGELINPLLATNIMDEKIYLQPHTQTNRNLPPHSANVKGRPNAYSGLTLIKRNPLARRRGRMPFRLLYIDGQSGHMQSVNPKDPMANLNDALRVFRKNGIDTSQAKLGLTGRVYTRKHPYSLSRDQEKEPWRVDGVTVYTQDEVRSLRPRDLEFTL